MQISNFLEPDESLTNENGPDGEATEEKIILAPKAEHEETDKIQKAAVPTTVAAAATTITSTTATTMVKTTGPSRNIVYTSTLNV